MCSGVTLYRAHTLKLHRKQSTQDMETEVCRTGCSLSIRQSGSVGAQEVDTEADTEAKGVE